MRKIVTCLAILFSACLISSPAQAGLKEIFYRACSTLLSFQREAKEVLATANLEKWGFDREILNEKFFAPHLSWLEKFAQGDNKAHFYLEWESTTTRQTVVTTLEKYSGSISTVNFNEVTSGGEAIVELSADQLRQVLSEKLVTRASFVVDVPDPAIFENLKDIPRRVLEKMSRGVLKSVLITDPYLSKKPLRDVIVLHFTDTLLDSVGFLTHSKVQILSVQKRSAFVRLSPEQLVQILDSKEITGASLSAQYSPR